MKIEILGVGCPKCKQFSANAEAAVKELNYFVYFKKTANYLISPIFPVRFPSAFLIR